MPTPPTEPARARIGLIFDPTLDLDARERRIIAAAAQAAAERQIALILEARRRDAALRAKGAQP